MTQFVNKKENIVTEAIDGIVAASGGKLARLDGYPHIRVVTRQDFDKSKVAVISGGGSGHEPSHAGFVGQNMLSAAVCGDIFASPSVDAVLAAILAVTGPAGCLLVVKNYTGDRLNFGLATERARAFGLKVNMVIVDDDIALPELAQARGVAGTLFVHKIAGAMSEQGADLESITETVKGAISKIKSIGMSLSTCSVPGSPKDDRIPQGTAELGLGIHGEPGIEQIEFSDVRQGMTALIAKLEAAMNDGPHIALLNNLGGTSELEMGVVLNELLNSSIKDKLTHIVGPATMMTALDMRGFSVSVIPAEPELLELIAVDTELAAWPGVKQIAGGEVLALPDGLKPLVPLASEHAETRRFLTEVCELFIASEADLNELDAKSGDGDTGSTLAGASKAIIAAMDNLPLADQTQLMRAIGQELSQAMGGSSGVLLAIFFAAAGDGSSSGLGLREALQAGLARMQEIGGAQLGDRTMVDSLHPALNELQNGIAKAAQAAREGANLTATMSKANAGRASYISADKLEGHIDPGSEAVARLFEHLARK